MKKYFTSLCFVLICSSVFCQVVRKPDYIRNDVRILSEAQIDYENQNYGSALKLVEEAKEARRHQIDWEIYTLRNAFKSFEVKKAGDLITDIIPVLEERQDYEAIKLVRKYADGIHADKIDNSKVKLLEYIQSVREFPEADKLSGDIYKLEGEYELASDFYTKAFKNASILDVPDEKYDILYSLADISSTLKDDEKYEKDLLLIVAQDNAFKDESLIRAMNSTISSVKPDCVEKFFNLYRADNYRLLAAYDKLSEYYESKHVLDKALNCSALCALTGFTKIYDVVSKRNPDFIYSGLESLLLEAAAYDDIVEWGIDNDVWKGFNVFAETAYKNTDPIFAVQLYSVLKDSTPEKYWREAAEIRLKEITLTR